MAQILLCEVLVQDLMDQSIEHPLEELALTWFQFDTELSEVSATLSLALRSMMLSVIPWIARAVLHEPLESRKCRPGLEIATNMVAN